MTLFEFGVIVFAVATVVLDFFQTLAIKDLKKRLDEKDKS